MQILVKRKPFEKRLASDVREKELLTANVFNRPKFDTDLQNYFYYTEVYKEWFQPK